MWLTSDWLRQPALQHLFAALSADSRPPRLVGGCVRDGVLNRAVTDIDLATPLPPEDVVVALQNAAIKAVPTGFDHGTVTAVIDHVGYEITTLRHDVETDGRRAVVAYTDDWRADAARRDFTINAMSADLDGAVYDYFDGIADARAGIVRFVGDAETRIREDYLRVLRFFRFQAWYGRQRPDSATLDALSSGVAGLGRLAAERIRIELIKWMAAPDPRPSWRLAEETRIAAWLFGDADSATLDRVVDLETETSMTVDPLRRLAALAPPPGPEIKALTAKLRLSNAETRDLRAIENAMAEASEVSSVLSAKRLAYRHGLEAARDALMLVNKPKNTQVLCLNGISSWVPPVFPVDGADAQRAGLPTGPKIGKVLRAVENWWVDRDFLPDRSACLAHLSKLIIDDA